MMKPLIGLTAATLGACTAPEPPANSAAEAPGIHGMPADCPLAIGFGSYAMGIDGGTLARVEALLAADPAVRSVERYPWGREGEVSLCVRLRGQRDAGRLFDRLKALLPAKPRGPIRLSTRDGRRFDAPRRGR